MPAVAYGKEQFKDYRLEARSSIWKKAVQRLQAGSL